jgi:hypothetical protein
MPISNTLDVKLDRAIAAAMGRLEASGEDITSANVRTEIDTAEFSPDDQMELALSGWIVTRLADVRQHMADTLGAARMADPQIADRMDKVISDIDDAIGIDDPQE